MTALRRCAVLAGRARDAEAGALAALVEALDPLHPLMAGGRPGAGASPVSSAWDAVGDHVVDHGHGRAARRGPAPHRGRPGRAARRPRRPVDGGLRPPRARDRPDEPGAAGGGLRQILYGLGGRAAHSTHRRPGRAPRGGAACSTQSRSTTQAGPDRAASPGGGPRAGAAAPRRAPGRGRRPQAAGRPRRARPARRRARRRGPAGRRRLGGRPAGQRGHDAAGLRLAAARPTCPTGLLDRDGGGWCLDVPREAVDALRAEDLVTGAGDDPAPLEQALGLWRGEPLAGLGDLPLAEGAGPGWASCGPRRRSAWSRCGWPPATPGTRPRSPPRSSRRTRTASPPWPSSPSPWRAAAATPTRWPPWTRCAAGSTRTSGCRCRPATADLHRRLLLHDPSLTGEPGRGRPAPRAAAPGRRRRRRRPGGPAPPARATAAVDAAAPDLADPSEPAGRRPAGTARRGLPVPLTSFVGRQDDIGAVHDALDQARLVTLVGPGGAGKTRLALEALRRREDRRRRRAVARGARLGRARPGRRRRRPGARGAVARDGDPGRGRRRRARAAAAARAGQLRARRRRGGGAGGAPARRVRRPAGPRHEPGGPRACRGSGCAVAPLGVGRPGRPGEAETLFVERARSVAPAFVLDATTAAPVARLVRALDGIPLAVELAAARLSVMGLDDMVAMLDQRFALLEGGARTSLPHQRTLAAAVGWSHDLLDEQERRLFAVASTFAGPFELAALRGLAEPELDRPVISVLASLTAKSMVQVDGTADLRSSRTYRLLETLRAYGREQTDPATAARLADRHAAWFAAEADEAFLGLRGPGTGRWLAHLDLVRPDMRAALAHAVARRRRPDGMRLVAGLSTYWFHRAHVQEGRSWLDGGPVPGRRRGRGGARPHRPGRRAARLRRRVGGRARPGDARRAGPRVGEHRRPEHRRGRVGVRRVLPGRVRRPGPRAGVLRPGGRAGRLRAGRAVGRRRGAVRAGAAAARAGPAAAGAAGAGGVHPGRRGVRARLGAGQRALHRGQGAHRPAPGRPGARGAVPHAAAVPGARHRDVDAGLPAHRRGRRGAPRAARRGRPPARRGRRGGGAAGLLARRPWTRSTRPRTARWSGRG